MMINKYSTFEHWINNQIKYPRRMTNYFLIPRKTILPKIDCLCKINGSVFPSQVIYCSESILAFDENVGKYDSLWSDYSRFHIFCLFWQSIRWVDCRGISQPWYVLVLTKNSWERPKSPKIMLGVSTWQSSVSSQREIFKYSPMLWI